MHGVFSLLSYGVFSHSVKNRENVPPGGSFSPARFTGNGGGCQATIGWHHTVTHSLASENSLRPLAALCSISFFRLSRDVGRGPSGPSPSSSTLTGIQRSNLKLELLLQMCVFLFQLGLDPNNSPSSRLRTSKPSIITKPPIPRSFFFRSR